MDVAKLSARPADHLRCCRRTYNETYISINPL